MSSGKQAGCRGCERKNKRIAQLSMRIIELESEQHLAPGASARAARASVKTTMPLQPVSRAEGMASINEKFAKVKHLI